MFDASAERSASISQFNCLKFQERLKRGKKGSLESLLAAKTFPRDTTRRFAWLSFSPFQPESGPLRKCNFLLLLSTETVFYRFLIFLFLSRVEVQLWKFHPRRASLHTQSRLHDRRRLSVSTQNASNLFSTFYHYFSKPDTRITFLRVNISTANENFTGKFSPLGGLIKKRRAAGWGEAGKSCRPCRFPVPKNVCAFSQLRIIFQFLGGKQTRI